MEKNIEDEMKKSAIASENLCAIMLFRNYSNEQLADALTISVSSVEKYRDGSLSLRNARASVVYEMSKTLNIGIDYLLGESTYDQMEVDIARKMSSKLLNEVLHRSKK